LSDSKTERPDWNSLHRLVQDLISGVSRRHTFTQWELEFLLDLQNSRLRKSAREVVLRKYLRAVHQCYLDGAKEPPRLSSFLAAASQ
jgi:hypothetical protein